MNCWFAGSASKASRLPARAHRALRCFRISAQTHTDIRQQPSCSGSIFRIFKKCTGCFEESRFYSGFMSEHPVQQVAAVILAFKSLLQACVCFDVFELMVNRPCNLRCVHCYISEKISRPISDSTFPAASDRSCMADRLAH